MWTYQARTRGGARVAICESGTYNYLLGYTVCPWGWRFEGRHAHYLTADYQTKGDPIDTPRTAA